MIKELIIMSKIEDKNLQIADIEKLTNQFIDLITKDNGTIESIGPIQFTHDRKDLSSHPNRAYRKFQIKEGHEYEKIN